MRRAAVLVSLALCVAACSRATTPAPTSAPTSAPTATSPSQPTLAPGQPTPAPTELPSDVENAFLSNVDDLTAEAADLAAAPCDELTAATSQNPNLLPSIRGFAATLKRLGASQAGLNTEAVRSALADLDRTLSQLDGTLNTCGIKAQP